MRQRLQDLGAKIAETTTRGGLNLRARLAEHAALLAGWATLGLLVTHLDHTQRWGRADFLSMEGLTTAAYWIGFGLHAALTTFLVVKLGTSRIKVALIHLVTPIAVLFLMAIGLVLLLVGVAALDHSRN